MSCSVADRYLGRHIGWAVILVVVTASASAAACATLFAEPPSTLRPGPVTTELPVNADRFEDPRSVQLSVKASVAIPLAAPGTGRVTAFPCEPGASIVSGTSPVSIDGTPRLALATRIPLWRDLTLDSKGDDVRAIQEELGRLGHSVATDGVMGKNTQVAVAAAFAEIGVTVGQQGVPLDAIVWIPSPESRLALCEVAVGATVERGAPLATFAVSSPTVSVDKLPTDLVPGPRVVVVGESRFEVTADGIVQVRQLSEFRSALGLDTSAELKPIDAQLVLGEPLDVSVVAPSSIYDIHDGAGCVSSRGSAHAVDILGSQLGETIVAFRGKSTPSHVDTPPQTDTSCR